jgi:hypothetical protein
MGVVFNLIFWGAFIVRWLSASDLNQIVIGFEYLKAFSAARITIADCKLGSAHCEYTGTVGAAGFLCVHSQQSYLLFSRVKYQSNFVSLQSPSAQTHKKLVCSKSVA